MLCYGRYPLPSVNPSSHLSLVRALRSLPIYWGTGLFGQRGTSFYIPRCEVGAGTLQMTAFSHLAPWDTRGRPLQEGERMGTLPSASCSYQWHFTLEGQVVLDPRFFGCPTISFLYSIGAIRGGSQLMSFSSKILGYCNRLWLLPVDFSVFKKEVFQWLLIQFPILNYHVDDLLFSPPTESYCHSTLLPIGRQVI